VQGDEWADEALCLECFDCEFLPTALRINFFYERSVDLPHSDRDLHYHRESATALGPKWQPYEWEAFGLYVDPLRHTSPEGFHRILIIDATTGVARDMELWEARARVPRSPLFLHKLWWPGRAARVGMGGLDEKGWTEENRKALWAARPIFINMVAKRGGGRPALSPDAAAFRAKLAQIVQKVGPDCTQSTVENYLYALNKDAFGARLRTDLRTHKLNGQPWKKLVQELYETGR